MEQGAGPGRDLQTAGIGRKRLRALDAALDFRVERSRQIVAIRAQAVVAQAGESNRRMAGMPRLHRTAHAAPHETR